MGKYFQELIPPPYRVALEKTEMFQHVGGNFCFEGEGALSTKTHLTFRESTTDHRSTH